MFELDEQQSQKIQSNDIVAFFDMDKTILSVNSTKLWAFHMWRQGDLKNRDLLKSMLWLMRYRLALVDIKKVSEEVSVHVIGKSEAQMRERVLQWYHEEIRQHIIPSMVDKIRSHQKASHKVVLLSAASPYICQPLCQELELDDFLCTHFEIEAGRFTGQLILPLCYGVGKIHWAQTWCDAAGVRLEDAYFYTDSFTDLPLLEKVGHAVVVNPDIRLRRWARQQNVLVLDCF